MKCILNYLNNIEVKRSRIVQYTEYIQYDGQDYFYLKRNAKKRKLSFEWNEPSEEAKQRLHYI